MGQLNFWDLNYLMYMLGFLLVPRVTIMLIFKNFVTGSFDWNIFFVGLTIWWKFPTLALGFWSKFSFMGLFVGAPRVLLAAIGYQYLSPENHVVMGVFAAIGGIIDFMSKDLLDAWRSRSK